MGITIIAAVLFFILGIIVGKGITVKVLRTDVTQVIVQEMETE